MLERLHARRLRARGTRAGVRPASGILPQIVNDGAGRCERLRMLIEAQSREFRDPKLLAQNPLGVVTLEDPVFETALDAPRAFEQGALRSFEKLLRAGKKCFARVEKLQFVAQGLIGIGPGKFRGLKFAG